MNAIAVAPIPSPPPPRATDSGSARSERESIGSEGVPPWPAWTRAAGRPAADRVLYFHTHAQDAPKRDRAKTRRVRDPRCSSGLALIAAWCGGLDPPPARSPLRVSRRERPCRRKRPPPRRRGRVSRTRALRPGIRRGSPIPPEAQSTYLVRTYKSGRPSCGKVSWIPSRPRDIRRGDRRAEADGQDLLRRFQAGRLPAAGRRSAAAHRGTTTSSR